MTDTKGMIKCPACGKEMEKVLIPEQDINIDICVDGCGGIFFDNREMEKFNSKEENVDLVINALEGRTFNKVDESAVRICPACGAKMVKFGAGNGNVTIDMCYTCGGKFLDNGELQKIGKADSQAFDETLNELVKRADLEAGPLPDQSRMRKFFEKMVRRYI